MSRPIRDLGNAVNLSDKHLQAIGEVAVRWGEIEDTLADLVWELANLRVPGAYAITAHLNERTLVNIGSSLVNLLVTGPEPKLASEIEVHLVKILEHLYPKRNAMVHSTWGHGGGTDRSTILPIKARGTLKFGPRSDYSADDIFAIAAEIVNANETLYAFVSRLRELIPTWRHIAKT